MKIVTLKAPTVVHDVLRQPIEGALTVSDAEAKRLNDNNLLAEDPVDVPAPDRSDAGTAENLDEMKLEDLGILATKEGVPLNGATKKADIVAAIQKHRAEKAA